MWQDRLIGAARSVDIRSSKVSRWKACRRGVRDLISLRLVWLYEMNDVLI